MEFFLTNYLVADVVEKVKSRLQELMRRCGKFQTLAQRFGTESRKLQAKRFKYCHLQVECLLDNLFLPAYCFGKYRQTHLMLTLAVTMKHALA